MYRRLYIGADSICFTDVKYDLYDKKMDTISSNVINYRHQLAFERTGSVRVASHTETTSSIHSAAVN